MQHGDILYFTLCDFGRSLTQGIYAHAGVGHGVEPLIQEQQAFQLPFITSWTCDYAHSTLAAVRLFQNRNDQKDRSTSILKEQDHFPIS